VETIDGIYRMISKPTIRTSPSSVICRKYCESFSLQLNVTEAYNVTALRLEIHYNTTLLDYVNVGWNAWGSGTISVDEANGNVTGYTSGSPITGTTTLMTITFHAAYYHIWKNVPGWTNNLTGTIYIQWANLSYLDAPNLSYQRGEPSQIQVDPTDVSYMFAPIKGDIDNDGDVDIFDIRTVAYYYDQLYEMYDLTGDHIVDILDLVIIAANFGYEYDC